MLGKAVQAVQVCIPGALLCFLMNAATVSAQADEARFSDQGRLMLGGEISGYWSNDEASYGVRTFADWDVSAWPAVVYFVRDRLGLGVSGGGGFSRTSFSATRREEVYAGALLRLRYDVALGERLGLLPSLSAGWIRSRREEVYDAQSVILIPATDPNAVQYGRGEVDYTHNVARVMVYLPLTFSPSPSVVLGFGPELVLDWLHFGVNEGVGEFVNSSAPGATIQSRSPHGQQPGPSQRVRVGASTFVGVSF